METARKHNFKNFSYGKAIKQAEDLFYMEVADKNNYFELKTKNKLTNASMFFQQTSF